MVAKTEDFVLVVDDEPSICWALQKMFSSQGKTVVTASSAEEGLDAISGRHPRLIMLDVRLPGRDGIDALPEFIANSQAAPVIVMTAFGDLETAVSAVKAGASDYITKPFSLEDVQAACDQVLNATLGNDSVPMANTLAGTGAPRSVRPSGKLIGRSPAMQAIFKQIALVADSDLAVLITGETGTGKELVAAAVHENSPRKDDVYLPVAPVTLNPTLIESELFGHVRGAFTGAAEDRAGIFEKADGGTVLLDEIGDLPISAQLKLLRVLDSGQFFRVGDVQPRHANVRIIASTNRDLREAVREGTFREDLFYRLNGLRMHLPPLRERKEDIPMLVRYFLGESDDERGEQSRVSSALADELCTRPWHGNVRELRNAVQHAAVIGRGRALVIQDFPPEQEQHRSSSKAGEDPVVSFRESLRAWCQAKIDSSEVSDRGLHNDLLSFAEPELIRFALELSSGNRSKAAELLGIHRGTLREKMKDEHPE